MRNAGRGGGVRQFDVADVSVFQAFFEPELVSDIAALVFASRCAQNFAAGISEANPGIIRICALKSLELGAERIRCIRFLKNLAEGCHIVQGLQALEHRAIELVLHFIGKERQRLADLLFQTAYGVVTDDIGNGNGKQKRDD